LTVTESLVQAHDAVALSESDTLNYFWE